jgi:transcriptional regulator with XRE-family HTH domain
MFPKEIFAQRLKQLCTNKNISMQKLADEIGLKNKGTIGQFETGITAPSSETLIALADYFNVSLDYLVGRSDKPERR